MNQTMKRLLSILLTLTLLLSLAPAVGLAAADDTLFYTLDGTITGGSNGYAEESEITQGDISWMVMGNTTMNPWRIGGKNLSNVDRPIYSQDKMETTVSKVEVTFGTNGLTVNSCKLIVASDASFDADTVIETKSFDFAASSTVTIEPGEGKVWKDAYFKFVFNVTTSGSGNKFFQFNSAKFYEAEVESDTVTFGKVTDVSQIVEENIGECTFEQAKAWVVANWADIVDGVGGDTYIDVLFMVEGQLHLIEFMRGNYNSAEQFDDNYTNDGTGESVTVAAFQDHYNNGDIVYLCGFEAEPAAHTHDEITFTAWTDALAAEQNGAGMTAANSLPAVPGNYYLTENVTLDTWAVQPGTTNLCLNGKTITGTHVNEVIAINANQEDIALNLFDETGEGVITSSSERYMPIVCVREDEASAAFTMNGGAIIGGNGAGVSVYGGTFTMNGGSITGCHPEYANGAGVLVGVGSFIMNGGSITGNATGGDGGGVYVASFAVFTMTGGSITENSAWRGGGVYVAGGYTYEAYPEYSSEAGMMLISGKVVIQDNTDQDNTDSESKPSNVWLGADDSGDRDAIITVVDALDEEAHIGVGMQERGVFTNSTGTAKAKDYADNFTSDNSAYNVMEEGDELKLALPPVYYQDADGTVKTCTDYEPVSAGFTMFEDGKWYVVSSDITNDYIYAGYDKSIHLILCDDATLTAGTIDLMQNGSLTVYAGSTTEEIKGNGALTVNTEYNAVNAFDGGALCINGGVVSLTSQYTTFNGGSLTVNGGSFTAYATGEGQSAISDQTTVTVASGMSVKAGESEATAVAVTDLNNWEHGEKWVRIEKATTHKYQAVFTPDDFFALDGSWNNNVSFYYWTSPNEAPIAWPGLSMTKMGDGTYVLTFETEEVPTHFILNDGATHAYNQNYYQTDDLDFVLNTEIDIYTKSGDYYGTCIINGIAAGAHEHNFTYTANGATVTASCEGCDITTGLTLTVSAPEGDPVYDGTTTYPATLNNDYNTTAFPGTYEISYTKDGEAFTGDPTEPGTYVASVTVGEDENAVTASVTYTIAKATPAAADFTFTAPESLTYDGSAKAATVVPALGVTGMGEVTVHYYSDAERTTEVLAANVVNAGTYYVGITAAEGDNYAAATTPLFADGWSFTITKATPELTNVSATAITYGDTLAQSTVTGTATNPISSANVPGTWAFTEGETAPVVADSDTTEYEVTFTPTDGDNYETATAMITLTVNKADPTFTAPEAKLLVYTGSEQELVTAGATEDGTILFSTDGENFTETIPTAMDYGTYDVWYKVVGDANHNDTEPVKLTSVIGLTIAGANTESAPVSFVENGERLYRYDVTIENIPENFEAIGLQVFLSFDADVLAFRRVESDFDYVIAQKDNTVQFAWASDTEGVLEDGQVLFSIIFAAPDCESGTETAIPFTVNALNVLSSVAVVKDGKVVSLPTFTVDGCIRFSVPLWGDANCDGVVTAADAALILRSVVGLSALSAVGAFNGDVDGDLVITAADAALVLRYVVGLIDLFPVEENN